MAPARSSLERHRETETWGPTNGHRGRNRTVDWSCKARKWQARMWADRTSRRPAIGYRKDSAEHWWESTSRGTGESCVALASCMWIAFFLFRMRGKDLRPARTWLGDTAGAMASISLSTRWSLRPFKKWRPRASAKTTSAELIITHLWLRYCVILNLVQNLLFAAASGLPRLE